MKNGVFVLGLDGATFDLIGPWVQEGKLPTFKVLMKRGAYGNLESTIQPSTNPAWISIASGKSTERLGFFSFLEKEERGYEARLSSINWDSINPIWRILSDSGKRVCIVNVPLCSHMKVNGIMVSGPFSYNKGTFPPELREELIRTGYYIPLVRFVEASEEEYLSNMMEMMKRKFKFILQYLDEEWDFLFFVIFNLDPIQHHFWKYMDKNHPDFKEYSKFRNSILEFYQEVDKCLSEILKKIKDGVHMSIVSDHGAGPAYKQIDLNKWLQNNGFLKLKSNITLNVKRKLISIIKLFYKLLTPFKLGRSIIKKTPESIKRKAKKLEIGPEAVKWDETKAYAFPSSPYGMIFINVKGRESNGIVMEGEEYERIRREIAEKLKEIKDPETETKLVMKVWKKEEIYSKGKLEMFPDLIVKFRNETMCVSSAKFMTGNLFSEIPVGSCAHRRNGIFMAYGPHIKEGFELRGSKVTDVAPTILHLLDVPIPTDVDGRVPKWILKANSEPYNRKIKYEKPPKHIEGEKIKITKEIEEELKGRLRELGYL